ncbi:MAG TPA: hypothetical protein VNL95_06320 [Dehalococcoidia bacterium]|nr:hypothetical protein [Dehalococcoidia bacterium]
MGRGKRPAALAPAALWLLAAAAALVALVLMNGPGRTEAHTTPGVEIIDTQALCDAHYLDLDVFNDNCDPGLWGVLADALPSHFLNLDTDNDGTPDAIVVRAGTAVLLAVHVRDASGDPNSTAAAPVPVFLHASGGKARFVAWSRAGAHGGLDGDGDGTDDTTADGALFDGLDSDNVAAQAVSDYNVANPRACTQDRDTCIDNGAAANPDGIAIFQVLSLEPTDSTITASTIDPSVYPSDSVRIIWVGSPASVTVASNEARLQQDTNPSSGVHSQGPGDVDATLTVTVRDSAGHPVGGEDVECSIDPAHRGRANIGPLTLKPDNGVAEITDPDGSSPIGDTESGVTLDNGTFSLVLETEDNGSRGDVTVTCWADLNGDHSQQVEEPSGSTTVRVVGPPASVFFPLPFSGAQIVLNVGQSTNITAQVRDSDGNPVADDVSCMWWSFGDVGGLISSSGPFPTQDGQTVAQAVGGSAGSFVVTASCPSGIPAQPDPKAQVTVIVNDVREPVAPPAPLMSARIGPVGPQGLQSSILITISSPLSPITSPLSSTFNITDILLESSLTSSFNFGNSLYSFSISELLSRPISGGGGTAQPLGSMELTIPVGPPTRDGEIFYYRISACNPAGCSPSVFVGALARRTPFGPNDWSFIVGIYRAPGGYEVWATNLVTEPNKVSDFLLYNGLQGFGGMQVTSCGSVAPGESCLRTFLTSADLVSISQRFAGVPEVGIGIPLGP